MNDLKKKGSSATAVATAPIPASAEQDEGALQGDPDAPGERDADRQPGQRRLARRDRRADARTSRAGAVAPRRLGLQRRDLLVAS